MTQEGPTCSLRIRSADPGSGRAGAGDAACRLAAESAKADFVNFQRRIHSLTGRTRRSPVIDPQRASFASTCGRHPIRPDPIASAIGIRHSRGRTRPITLPESAGASSRYSLFPIPYSLFPIPYSLFPIPYSLFPVPYSLFPVPYSLPFRDTGSARATRRPRGQSARARAGGWGGPARTRCATAPAESPTRTAAAGCHRP
jgi:hypothetical protein